MVPKLSQGSQQIFHGIDRVTNGKWYDAGFLAISAGQRFVGLDMVIVDHFLIIEVLVDPLLHRYFNVIDPSTAIAEMRGFSGYE